MNTKIIIFDMDGTLLNTLPDLADSTNAALEHFNFPQKSIDDICDFIGNGVGKLIERAIPSGIDNPYYNDCLSLFKELYEQNMNNKTAPYKDILVLLKELKNRGIKTAIVSNKFDKAVKELAQTYFKDLIDISIGENEEKGIKKKPAPDMIFKILEHFNLSPDDAIYVGDSDTDIQTAQNSSIKCLSAGWGYRSKEFLKQNGASIILDTPLEILNFI